MFTLEILTNGNWELIAVYAGEDLKAAFKDWNARTNAGNVCRFGLA